MNDSFDLQRFVDAPAAIYLWIVEELLRDENRHTGCDSLCRRSSVLVSVPWLNASLGTRAEAVAYLEDGLLGPRLVECTRLVDDAFRRPLEAVNLCGSRRRLLCRREGPCDFRNSGNEPTPIVIALQRPGTWLQLTCSFRRTGTNWMEIVAARSHGNRHRGQRSPAQGSQVA